MAVHAVWRETSVRGDHVRVFDIGSPHPASSSLSCVFPVRFEDSWRTFTGIEYNLCGK